jgi:recombinational DNA repair protein (RecF pathway)
MAILKYVTECIVIDSFERGEHDMVFKLFTREYGLVMAQAKSVRKLESKLRAHLLPRTVSLVTLVQGKEVWRLVGAESQTLSKNNMHEVAHLVKRFIRGEGQQKSLYDRLMQFCRDEVKYDEQKGRLLLYYVFLVELGYADAKIIGAKNIKEYISFSVDDLYTRLLLSYDQVRMHTQAVLKEMQL